MYTCNVGGMVSQAGELLPLPDGEPGNKFTLCQSLVPGSVALSLIQQELRSSWGEFCRFEDSLSFWCGWKCRQQSGWEVHQFPSAFGDVSNLPPASQGDKNEKGQNCIDELRAVLKNLTAVICRWGRRNRGSDLSTVTKEEQS